MTSRDNVQGKTSIIFSPISIPTFVLVVAGYSTLLGMELGAGARHRAKFLTMDIREVEAVREHREMIVKKFGGLDILVNNAGIYQKPDLTMFSAQSKEIMLTNYWGTKNVITAFYDDFNPNSRIVNITSNLAHVKSAVSKEEEELKDCAREKFASAESAAELDGLVCQFQIHASLGTWKKEGWPTCAYSVSKMAINAYTRYYFADRHFQC